MRIRLAAAGVAVALVGVPQSAFAAGRVVTGDGASNVLGGGNDDDFVFGGSGNDTIFGMRGDDQLFGEHDHDTVLGGAGVDIIDGETSGVFGRDRLVDDDGTPGDQLRGGSLDDVLFSLDGAADTLDCGDHYAADLAFADLIDDVRNCEEVHQLTDGDVYIGTNQADRLNGTIGHDSIFGMRGPDVITGSSGVDAIYPGKGGDEVDSGTDADRIWDDDGDRKHPDHLRGGDGDDTVFSADGGKDFIDCGSGIDTVYLDVYDKQSRCETVWRIL